MKVLVLYPYPVEPDGQSLQGDYLMKGLRENGVDARPCDREDGLQKEWLYKSFKPDAVVGIGFWGDTPKLIHDVQRHDLTPVPWFNANGWVANYHDTLNKLPLLVATSNWVKSTYERDGVSGNNTRVCSIGYDPRQFYPMPKNDASVRKLRHMLGVKDDEKMILTVGGDVTSKGAQEMFKALAKIDSKFSKWKYVCKVWESFSARNHGREERAMIKELGLDTKKISFIDGKFSPEFMGVLLNACDVYAAPSRLEGFGMIQLEAQACGKPVISIDVGGPKDTIVHNETGFLAKVEHEVKLESEWVTKDMGFDKKQVIEFPVPKTFAYRADVNELADYTLKLLTDDNLRERMGKAAAEHALKNFHYKVTAKVFKDHLHEKILK